MDRLLLVHGAFHGAWCWDRLSPELERRGIEHATVDLPFVSSEGDVAAVRQAADRLGAGGSGVCLLGHSFGGAVISAAGAEDGRPYGPVRSLIYLTAIMTAPGQVVDFSGGPGMAAIEMAGPTASFDRSRAAEGFYHRCPPDDAAWATGHLRDMPTELLAAPPPAVPAWQVLPSTYIVCSDDRILSLSAQHQMAANASSSVTIDSDHSPFLACPGVLADTIAGILTG